MYWHTISVTNVSKFEALPSNINVIEPYWINRKELFCFLIQQFRQLVKSFNVIMTTVFSIFDISRRSLISSKLFGSYLSCDNPLKGSHIGGLDRHCQQCHGFSRLLNSNKDFAHLACTIMSQLLQVIIWLWVQTRADPEQCCWGGCQNCWGGASLTARSAVEQVRLRQREALAEGAAAGVWGRKNRSPRVLECTWEHQKCQKQAWSEAVKTNNLEKHMLLDPLYYSFGDKEQKWWGGAKHVGGVHEWSWGGAHPPAPPQKIRQWVQINLSHPRQFSFSILLVWGIVLARPAEVLCCLCPCSWLLNFPTTLDLSEAAKSLSPFFPRRKVLREKGVPAPLSKRPYSSFKHPLLLHNWFMGWSIMNMFL